MFKRRILPMSVICGAIALSVAAADRLRAHYELNVREGTSLKTVQSFSDVTPGVPIEVALDKYKLALSIDVGQSSTYVLAVSVAPAASPNDVLVKGTFNGSLVAASSGPLEFDLDQNGLKVSGAIALSFVHQ
jgi:hypothetical protein